MKASMNIRSIIMVMAIIGMASMFFINICFATNTGKITTETARLREQPNTNSKVLELASYGEEVEILEEIENWYKVKYKKITGYIRSDLIQTENKSENKTENIINTITENEVSKNEINESKIEENTESKDPTTTETDATPVKEKNIEKGKYKLSENVKIKIIPLISAIELDEIKKDTEVEVIEILNNWTKIRTQEGKEGWIRAEKLTDIQENIENNTKSANKDVEDNKNTSEDEAKKLNSSTQESSRSATTTRNTTTQENTQTSTNVSNQKQQENTNSSTTENTKQPTTTKPPTNISETTSQSGSAVVAYAKQFLGCKYVYGGTTTNGFDCSGFTQYVYKHFGVSLNRTAAAQYSNGKSVTELQAGDLVMFGKSGINHVGIYIGGNTFIHAANTSRGVTTDTLSSGYYKTNYVGARRIF